MHMKKWLFAYNGKKGFCPCVAGWQRRLNKMNKTWYLILARNFSEGRLHSMALTAEAGLA